MPPPGRRAARQHQDIDGIGSFPLRRRLIHTDTACSFPSGPNTSGPESTAAAAVFRSRPWRWKNSQANRSWSA